MWLPDGSLLHLQSILTGCRVALGVHGIGEPFDFWPGERFTQWLHERRGTSSSLTWAAEIERITPPDSTPVAEFFVLLDAFRHDVAPAPVEAVRRTGLPSSSRTTTAATSTPSTTASEMSPATARTTTRRKAPASCSS